MRARQVVRKIRWKVEKYAPKPWRVRGWLRDRCETCGHRRRYVEAWHTYGNRDGKVWHRYCIAYEQWRTHAEERLAVLDLVCDVWGVSQRDVESVVALRTEDNANGIGERNRAWRVMHSLNQHREKAAS